MLPVYRDVNGSINKARRYLDVQSWIRQVDLYIDIPAPDAEYPLSVFKSHGRLHLKSKNVKE